MITLRPASRCSSKKIKWLRFEESSAPWHAPGFSIQSRRTRTASRTQPVQTGDSHCGATEDVRAGFGGRDTCHRKLPALAVVAKLIQTRRTRLIAPNVGILTRFAQSVGASWRFLPITAKDAGGTWLNGAHRSGSGFLKIDVPDRIASVSDLHRPQMQDVLDSALLTATGERMPIADVWVG